MTLSSGSGSNGAAAGAPAPPAAQLDHLGRRLVAERGRRTVSVSLSEIWRMDYGDAGFSGKALLDYTRWRQTRDARFFRQVEAAADRYLAEGLPEDTRDLWPRAAGQVISLLAALSRESTIPAPKRAKYLEFARHTADLALRVFSKNGLFRADGSARHY